MNEIEKFAHEVDQNITNLGNDSALQDMSTQWLQKAGAHGYTYNFTWMGRPIIQTPQDIMALQELIWSVKPDLIVETGIAHGGSLIFSASMLELIGDDGDVLGVDIDIREHNRVEIEKHSMFKRIRMIQGSSIDESIVKQVFNIAKNKKRVLVILDSNHTHEHVAKELEMYSPLVKLGSYIVVMDTAVEDMPAGSFPNRPWDKGDNPKTAVWEFLE
ncbi:MAG: CmcI family methyltransferase, partial [Mariprofundaceae bacterium]